jgi:glycosyltransferase involved in cell wall biosynthesis
MKVSVIIPTLNEAELIPSLLSSLRNQTSRDFETLVVDGGSSDSTVPIAESFGAEVFALPASPEFTARNYGADQASFPLLLFTCADAIFPADLLERVNMIFARNQDLTALTGPDIPYDGGPLLRFEYAFYNILRLIFSRLPRPVLRFSTSTNLLVVRREAFENIGRFHPGDVNADGLLGRTLATRYRVLFDDNIRVYVSARRARKWGITRFSRHYLYVLENFIPKLSEQHWFSILKSRSSLSHGQIHGPKNN